MRNCTKPGLIHNLFGQSLHRQWQHSFTLFMNNPHCQSLPEFANYPVPCVNKISLTRLLLLRRRCTIGYTKALHYSISIQFCYYTNLNSHSKHLLSCESVSQFCPCTARRFPTDRSISWLCPPPSFTMTSQSVVATTQTLSRNDFLQAVRSVTASEINLQLRMWRRSGA